MSEHFQDKSSPTEPSPEDARILLRAAEAVLIYLSRFSTIMEKCAKAVDTDPEIPRAANFLIARARTGDVTEIDRVVARFLSANANEIEEAVTGSSSQSNSRLDLSALNKFKEAVSIVAADCSAYLSPPRQEPMVPQPSPRDSAWKRLPRDAFGDTIVDFFASLTAEAKPDYPKIEYLLRTLDGEIKKLDPQLQFPSASDAVENSDRLVSECVKVHKKELVLPRNPNRSVIQAEDIPNLLKAGRKLNLFLSAYEQFAERCARQAQKSPAILSNKNLVNLAEQENEEISPIFSEIARFVLQRIPEIKEIADAGVTDRNNLEAIDLNNLRVKLSSLMEKLTEVSRLSPAGQLAALSSFSTWGDVDGEVKNLPLIFLLRGLTAQLANSGLDQYSVEYEDFPASACEKK